jgi:hypothetical protein
MVNKNDVNCGALVLAYSIEQPLVRSCGQEFYIPSQCEVQTAFGYSLKKIFGEIKEFSYFDDEINWHAIKDLGKLERRIKEGIGGITNGDRDYQNIFEMYLSGIWGTFEHIWVYGKGDFYRFKDRKREEIDRKFDKYWTKLEKAQWTQIHEFMREYAQKNMKIKNGTT